MNNITGQERDGIIYGRTCANVIIQKDWINKEEVSSPRVELESVISMSVINNFKIKMLQLWIF